MRRLLAAAGVLLYFSFWGVLASAASPNSAQITLTAPNLPEEMHGRTLLATVGAGPSDSLADQVVLSDLNGYAETVTVEPGTYYCNAAVQYDPAKDYPVTEADGVYEVTLAAGESVTLTYVVSTVGFYESITGDHRYAQSIDMLTPPIDYEADALAQIGAYLTAPEGFDHHVIVYLGNQYTGESYTLDVYAANNLAALKTDAKAGQYQFLGARVTDDEAGRYDIVTETDSLDTINGAVFHLTVTDTHNPDRLLTTPSKDNNPIVQQAEVHNGDGAAFKPTPAPSATPGVESNPNPKNTLLDLLPQIITAVVLLVTGGVIRALRKKIKEV